ncbi:MULTISPECIES: isoprenylcysteine carboxylmethyltransferase family protein [unclassified Wenzhouxiangella]|uniref:methyltransferase family protein n=1 Tax=unclassified Wenzhouxiangella TaxID=2613841 RepID=UPI0021620D6A|nr:MULTISPECIES: isoprenylcysteine carboxylmethyltransferase family protein [unclassified Wenzhouxiangella]
MEAKLPPLLVVALVAAAMWGTARATVSFESAFWLRLGLAGLLLVAAVVLVVAGLLEFRRANTTVNPMAPEESSTVVRSGVYHYSRNPMYLGFLVALIGWAVWLAAPWALLGPALYVVWMTRFQIIPEERALAEQFGADYLDYCRRTRRWV